MFWLLVLGGGVAVFASFLLIGLAHLRHSVRVAERAIEGISIEEIPALRAECVRVFQDVLGVALDLEDYEASAEQLSGCLDDAECLKQAFKKDDFYWYFVLPVGAYMGELLRVHLNAAWRVSELGGPEMEIPLDDDAALTFPFHKVIKQVTAGDPGDVYAYLMASRQLDKITEASDPNADG